ncbi:MAG: tRNA (adenosine(37)-N6)-threonylcarbamoyltransferase complex ATPase subunit type 1 TsaE [Actinomycetes bacterium]
MQLPVVAETNSPEETEQIGERFASLLEAGDRVLVLGDLGAGKTAFVRGVCRGLGVSGVVTSPTFTLARRYEDGRIPVSHLDLYRLPEGLVEQEPGLLEDELAPDRVALVEWPQRASEGWFSESYRVELQHLGEHSRRVTVG